MGVLGEQVIICLAREATARLRLLPEPCYSQPILRAYKDRVLKNVLSCTAGHCEQPTVFSFQLLTAIANS